MQIIEGLFVLGVFGMVVLGCVRRTHRRKAWIRVAAYAAARAVALQHLDEAETSFLKEVV